MCCLKSAHQPDLQAQRCMGLREAQAAAGSFNHTIGAQEHGRRYRKAADARGFQIHCQLELDGLLHR